jgi:lactoylglutathione lyase
MPTKKTTTKKKTDIRRKAAQKPSAKQASPRTKGLQLTTAAPGFTVNDLDKSLTWYRDVLGFTIKERWEREGKLMGAELGAGSVSFYIGQDDWKKGRDRVKGEGFRLYCTTTQDIDKLAAEIKTRGGRFLEEPHDQPWGGRAFGVADPDGFKVTISKD